MPNPSPQMILDYWFGHASDALTTATRQAHIWWSKDPEIDAMIRTRFGALLEAAANEQLDTWEASPSSELAQIILLDQFPRNIYRNQPRCFAYDTQALALCLDGLGRQSDLALRPVEQVFFYLPLEHAENLAHQQRSVELFTRLIDRVSHEQRAPFERFLEFAVRHRDIIARFGRFPHRNNILQRPSTPDEQEFLSLPGSSF